MKFRKSCVVYGHRAELVRLAFSHWRLMRCGGLGHERPAVTNPDASAITRAQQFSGPQMPVARVKAAPDNMPGAAGEMAWVMADDPAAPLVVVVSATQWPPTGGNANRWNGLYLHNPGWCRW